MQSTLRKVLADEQLSLSIEGQIVKSPASPMRTDILQAVSSLTGASWPGVPTVPTMLMAATDGLYLRATGIPTYGIQGFFMDDFRIHGRDERMRVTSFFEGRNVLISVGENSFNSR